MLSKADLVWWNGESKKNSEWAASPIPSSVRLELSRKFDALPIFKRDRATALYHLCAALEMSTNPYSTTRVTAVAPD